MKLEALGLETSQAGTNGNTDNVCNMKNNGFLITVALATAFASTEVRASGVQAPADVRVAPLTLSKWGQTTNSMYTGIGTDCYNYLTPGKRPCGCVVTAMTQLMRYHEYPVTAKRFVKSCMIDGLSRSLWTDGGEYDYANMPLVPEANEHDPHYAGGATAEEIAAIAKLTYDCSVAMHTRWLPDGAWSNGEYAYDPLMAEFSYQSAKSYFVEAGASIPLETLRRLIVSNLDAKYPMLLGLFSQNPADPAHEIVVDGYGYSADNSFCVHINGGWNGLDDGWYRLPEIPFNGKNYTIINSIIYNVFPDKTGDIVSGRVLASDGTPVSEGARVWATDYSGETLGEAFADENGIYAIVMDVAAAAAAQSTDGRSYSFLLHAEYTPKGADAAKTGTLQATIGISANPQSVNFVQNTYRPGNMHPGNSCDQDITLSDFETVAIPQVSSSGGRFYPETTVSVTCETPGATIRYTTNGSTPNTSSTILTGGTITIDNTMALSVRAFKPGMNPSPTLTVPFTYAPPGDYFTDPIEIEGASGINVISNNGRYTTEPIEESPSPGPTIHTDSWTEPDPQNPDNTINRYYATPRTTWYKWTAPGSGQMTFKADCVDEDWYGSAIIAIYSGEALDSLERLDWNDEPNDPDMGDYFVAVSIDVVQGETYYVAAMDTCLADWAGGELTLMWDGELSTASDEPTSVLVSDGGSMVEVTYEWLDEAFPNMSETARTAAEYEALAYADTDGDGFANWQEYIMRTNPTDATKHLKFTKIEVGAGGVPTAIEWTPASGYLEGYKAVLKGANDISTSPISWSDVGDTASAFHFFKVSVEREQQ